MGLACYKWFSPTGAAESSAHWLAHLEQTLHDAMHLSAFSFREGCGGSPLSSNRAFLMSMGRNFRARKELKWVFPIHLPQVRGVCLLSSPTLITYSCFETLDIPVGSTVHPSSTNDHGDHNMYPVGALASHPDPHTGLSYSPE